MARNNREDKNEVDIKKTEKNTKPWHKIGCAGKDTIWKEKSFFPKVHQNMF